MGGFLGESKAPLAAARLLISILFAVYRHSGSGAHLLPYGRPLREAGVRRGMLGTFPYNDRQLRYATVSGSL